LHTNAYQFLPLQALLEGALCCALDVVATNRQLHERLSRQLELSERLEGEALAGVLADVAVPPSLRDYVLRGVLPSASRLQTLLRQSAMVTMYTQRQQ
jgi:hypothetical protein